MTMETMARQAWYRLPVGVRGSRFVQPPKRLALAVLGRPAPPHDAPAAPAPAAPSEPAGPAPRVIRTLPELDEMLVMLDEAAKVSDDELRRGFQTFVMDLKLDLPRRPLLDGLPRPGVRAVPLPAGRGV